MRPTEVNIMITIILTYLLLVAIAGLGFILQFLRWECLPIVRDHIAAKKQKRRDKKKKAETEKELKKLSKKCEKTLDILKRI